MTTITPEGRIVTGLFNDREAAERAYQSTAARGYEKDDINLVMSDDTRKRHFSTVAGAQTELGTKAAEGAGVGGAIGGTVGAVLGAIAAVGTSIAIPGLGFGDRGTVGSGDRGAGAGGVTGGLVGALVGWGIPEERVKRYEAGIKNGGILMGVKPRSEADARYLQEEWKKHNAADVYA